MNELTLENLLLALNEDQKDALYHSLEHAQSMGGDESKSLIQLWLDAI